MSSTRILFPFDLHDSSHYTFPNRFRSVGAHELIYRDIVDVANVVHADSDQPLEVIREQNQPARFRAHGGFPSTIPPSMTVTIVPRRLISPHTVSGAPGSLVVRCVGTISRNDSMSQANTLPPTSNASRRRVGIRGSSSTVCSGGIVTDSLIESETT